MVGDAEQAMNKAYEQKLEHIISRMNGDRSVDAPEDALKYARNLFRTRAAEPSLLQRIVAVLKVDLAPDRAAFGERSAGSAARQMMYESGDNAVDLRITASANGSDIRGQIFGDDLVGGEAMIANAEFSASAVIEETSGFRFSSIPSGEYTLTLSGGNHEIVIEELRFK